MFIFGCHSKKNHPDARTLYAGKRGLENVGIGIGMCERKIVLVCMIYRILLGPKSE